MSEPTLERSPLHQAHLNLGARMVPFAGWEMPVQYEGILPEHRAVRNSCGVFDISHMGELVIEGAEAAAFLNRLLTNDVSQLSVGTGHYTLLLNENGGVIDDLILYRFEESAYFLVVNASRKAEDLDWIRQHAPSTPDLTITDLSPALAALAVQGPDAAAIYEKLLGDALPLPPRNGIARHQDLWVCRTGYTGEDGFEFFCPVAESTAWLERFLAEGATPCGLGARDTLRLEMGYPLNGNDLSPERSPIEAGLGFFAKLTKGEFIGSATLTAQKQSGTHDRLCAIQLSGKAPPPRPGYSVLFENAPVATLTSGALSPSLNQGIGMAYLPHELSKIGTALALEIRGNMFPASVVKKPFYQPTKTS